MKSTIVKEVSLKLRGKDVIAKFPNIGQSIRIENMKQTLSEGRYAIMAYSGMKTTDDMLDIIDSICYLSNVIPDFYTNLGINTHQDLLNMDRDSPILNEVLSQYKDVYQPFYNELYQRTDRPVDRKKEGKKEA